MRPRFTQKSALLLFIAFAIFGALAFWIKVGMPLPGQDVPSTAGKIAFVSERDGQSDIRMINASGGEAVSLTEDSAMDFQPSWSRKGDRITFVSDRREGYLQVFLTDAVAGREARPLTITSQAKDDPVFGFDGRVYYLSSGRLTATEPGTTDADAVYPTADMQRLPNDPLVSGGFRWARPAPNARVEDEHPRPIGAVLGMESGEALLLARTEMDRPLLLGVAQDILPAWLPDGRLAAVFNGGGPVGPVPLPEIPLPPPGAIDRSFLVLFAADGNVAGVVPLPFAPQGFEISPDGKLAALTSEEGKTGLAVVPMSGGKPVVLYEKPVSKATWSPDGSTIAFASEGDLWTIPAKGGDARNITGGKYGAVSTPAWSPARK